MDYSKLIWSANWLGYEVGYDNISIVGLYNLVDFPEIYIYVDTEAGEIIEAWSVNDD